MQTFSATYEDGTLILRSKRRLPFRNHERLLIRIVRPSDPIEGTRGIIHVSKRFARALMTPHRHSLFAR
jgi:hypothetical protein